MPGEMANIPILLDRQVLERVLLRARRRAARREQQALRVVREAQHADAARLAAQAPLQRRRVDAEQVDRVVVHGDGAVLPVG